MTAILGDSILARLGTVGFYNDSQPGLTVENASLPEDRVRHLIIALGGNDLHSGKPPEVVFNDLQKLVEKAQTKFQKVSVATVCPRLDIDTGKIKALNKLICKMEGVYPLRLYFAFKGPDGVIAEDSYSADGVHPSPTVCTRLQQMISNHCSKLGLPLDGPANMDQSQMRGTVQRVQQQERGGRTNHWRGRRANRGRGVRANRDRGGQANRHRGRQGQHSSSFRRKNGNNYYIYF